MTKLLQLLEEDCTLTHEQLAAMADMTVEEVKAAVKKYEEEKVILGYQAIVDWNTTDREDVTALIEVKVIPQREEGFDRIAERIYQYDEVEALYLMSGAFDFTVIISGRTLREVASFVSDRLAPLEGVTSTATHFILKKYKENHLLFLKDFDIHYSNNMSEKDLRICKNRQKMAGGFRTEAGREMYCDIISCIETIKRRGLNIYQSIIGLMADTPVI